MFLSLLGITFLVSFIVCFTITRLFTKPIDSVLERIIADDIAYAWTKYLQYTSSEYPVVSKFTTWSRFGHPQDARRVCAMEGAHQLRLCFRSQAPAGAKNPAQSPHHLVRNTG